MGLLRCSKCKAEKNPSQFPRDSRRPNGLGCWCKQCRREYQRERRLKYPDRSQESDRRFSRTPIGRCKIALKQATYAAKVKGYAPPSATVDQLLRCLPGCCDICGKPESGGRRLCMDHCHKTGKFRGWICDRCNVTLGRVNDSVSILIKMVSYLRR